jgi:hypothetical protein
MSPRPSPRRSGVNVPRVSRSVLAAELIDPATAGGSVTFVAHTTVLAVDERLVNQGGLDALAYFEDLREQCGCGTYAEGSVTGGR